MTRPIHAPNPSWKTEHVPQVKMITFDLDNTLWDVQQVIVKAEAKMRGWLDVHVPEYTSSLDQESILEIRRGILLLNAGCKVGG